MDSARGVLVSNCKRGGGTRTNPFLILAMDYRDIVVDDLIALGGQTEAQRSSPIRD